MPVKQIFDIVNEINTQAMGGELTIVNNTDLIALGNKVLSSSTYTELFMNALTQRIGKTIISFRKYRNMFADLVISDFEYGNIVQKIKIEMPAVERDESYNLQNGVAVDHYKVRKPVAKQKLFTSETPWEIAVTVQREHLKSAFTSASEMGSFISAIFGEMQNKIELSYENLARNCVNNFIGEVAGTAQAINLLDKYNNETNADLTIATAKRSPEFLRYVIEQVKIVSDRMQSMTTIYNAEDATRHTPKELQRMYILSDFQRRMETVVEYAAFNEEYVKLDGYRTVPFWQSISAPAKINVNKASDSEAVELDNIIGVIFDRDALGTYKRDMWSRTTPFNAAGGYANTFYHSRDIWFNDLSENFVVFYMAEV